MRLLIAAAVPVGAIVRYPAYDQSGLDLEITKIENGTPEFGTIRWWIGESSIDIDALEEVEIVHLPKRKEKT